MTRPRSRARALAGAAVALALLSACSDDDGAASSTSTTQSANDTRSALAAAATTTTKPCEPGGSTRVEGSVRVREFCGPAQAEVRLAGEALQFASGQCERHEDWLALNLGVEVIEPTTTPTLPAVTSDASFSSFTLLMGRHPLAGADAAPVGADGVFTTGVLTFAIPHRTYLVDDKTITLVGTRSAGVFSGGAFLGEGRDGPIPVEGTFTCDAAAIPLENVAGIVESLRPG